MKLMHLNSVFRAFQNAGSRAGAIVLLAALALAIFTPTVQADPARPSFLRTLEIRSADLSKFTKWTSALRRAQQEAARLDDGVCGSEPACSYQQWQRFLDTLRDRSKWEQLEAINAYMNARPYVRDERNWGTKDYWQTPGEFLARAGDCEDFAIAKFLSLKRLGWSDDELRIVAVKDTKLGVGHAVLTVSLEGRFWVLDNQLDDVTDIETLEHYEPVFSINETAWWRHQGLGNKA